MNDDEKIARSHRTLQRLVGSLTELLEEARTLLFLPPEVVIWEAQLMEATGLFCDMSEQLAWTRALPGGKTHDAKMRIAHETEKDLALTAFRDAAKEIT
mgnify:CR=1 FL=1